MGNSIVIMDSFALPVQGTETRVNAANEANEYMVTYIQECEKVRLSDALQQLIKTHYCGPRSLLWIGQTARECDRVVSFPPGLWVLAIWHRRRHPNEQSTIPRSFCSRCCMSTDMSSSTIRLTLSRQIDPNRTISAGKVDIGAFRTYPKDYTPPTSSASEYQSIPLAKIEDFGAHANQYYQLEVEIFKSSLDEELLGLLWNKYWVNTLSGSNLISVRVPTSTGRAGSNTRYLGYFLESCLCGIADRRFA